MRILHGSWEDPARILLLGCPVYAQIFTAETHAAGVPTRILCPLAGIYRTLPLCKNLQDPCTLVPKNHILRRNLSLSDSDRLRFLLIFDAPHPTPPGRACGRVGGCEGGCQGCEGASRDKAAVDSKGCRW